MSWDEFQKAAFKDIRRTFHGPFEFDRCELPSSAIECKLHGNRSLLLGRSKKQIQTCRQTHQSKVNAECENSISKTPLLNLATHGNRVDLLK